MEPYLMVFMSVGNSKEKSLSVALSVGVVLTE